MKTLKEDRHKYRTRVHELEKMLQDAMRNIKSRDALIQTLEECTNQNTQHIDKLQVSPSLNKYHVLYI